MTRSAGWMPFFMSDPDIPDRIFPAIRWAIVVIVLFVLALGISDTMRDGKYDQASYYSALFVVTFLIAVKWKWLADKCHQLAHFIGRRKVTMFYIGLAIVCALGLGIAVGKLMGRTGDGQTKIVATPGADTGRIVWNFEQTASGQGFFLTMNRLNQDEIRVIGFGGHGKNTSKDPITQFSGYIRSDLTNARLPLLILAQDLSAPAVPGPFANQMIPTRPEETYGIPGSAEFDVVTNEKMSIESGKDGMPASQFLREFGTFTVVLEYDGTTFERRFSEAEIKRQIEAIEATSNPQKTTKPRVTRKPNARPAVDPFLPLSNINQPKPNDQAPQTSPSEKGRSN